MKSRLVLVFEYIPLVAKLQPKYWSVISVRKKYDGLLKNVLDYILLCALKIALMAPFIIPLKHKNKIIFSTQN